MFLFLLNIEPYFRLFLFPFALNFGVLLRQPKETQQQKFLLRIFVTFLLTSTLNLKKKHFSNSTRLQEVKTIRRVIKQIVLPTLHVSQSCPRKIIFFYFPRTSILKNREYLLEYELKF
jgi:hypothetical protein